MFYRFVGQANRANPRYLQIFNLSIKICCFFKEYGTMLTLELLDLGRALIFPLPENTLAIALIL